MDVSIFWRSDHDVFICNNLSLPIFGLTNLEAPILGMGQLRSDFLKVVVR